MQKGFFTAAGGGAYWYAGLSVLPVRRAAWAQWHCHAVLLRGGNLALRSAQHQCPCKGHPCAVMPDAELCQRGRHLHLCGHGYAGPPEVEGAAWLWVLLCEPEKL